MAGEYKLAGHYFSKCHKQLVNTENDSTANQQEYLEMHKSLLAVAIPLLFFPSLLIAQQQTLIKPNKQAAINTTNNTVNNEFPKELIGLWVLDKAASSHFAKSHPRWNPNIEKQFAKLLQINESLVHGISAGHFSAQEDKQDMTMSLNFIRKAKNTYDFTLSLGEKNIDLSIVKTSQNLINIQANGLLGYEFLLWKSSPLSERKS
ncbi:hypothetical protein AAD001_04680 [Colwelliaceae bacterium 6471]